MDLILTVIYHIYRAAGQQEHWCWYEDRDVCGKGCGECHFASQVGGEGGECGVEYSWRWMLTLKAFVF